MTLRYLDHSEVIDFTKPFYQSRGWIEVLEKEHIPAYRIVIEDDNGQLRLYSAIYVYPLGKLGTQLYIPRGPIQLEGCTPAHLDRLHQEIRHLARKHQSAFCMIEPDTMPMDAHQQLTTIAQASDRERIPHQTQKIDTTQSEETILADMKSKTRYNINLAQKKGVEVTRYNPDHPKLQEAFNIFYGILETTSSRNSFHIHSRDHYLKILTTQTENFTPFLLVARHEDTVLGANLMLDTCTETIYLHGGSTNQKRNLMGTYLLQWVGIKSAIDAQKQSYDFWGTSDAKSSWSGLTKFKRGFGGYTVDYPQTRVIITNPLIYWLYQTYTRLRS